MLRKFIEYTLCFVIEDVLFIITLIFSWTININPTYNILSLANPLTGDVIPFRLFSLIHHFDFHIHRKCNTDYQFAARPMQPLPHLTSAHPLDITYTSMIFLLLFSINLEYMDLTHIKFQILC
jgi:hypothetical protein